MRIVALFLILSVTACSHTSRQVMTPKRHSEMQKRADKKNFENFQVSAVPQNKKKPILIRKQTNSKLNELDTYSQLLDFYEKKNHLGFIQQKDLFESQFPSSPYLDEVYYMSALMSLSQNRYGDALAHLNTVTKFYGNSNKAGSALFAKGIVYKRMNLKNKARTTFLQVQQSYPGSPEAKRADLELKLLK